MKSLLRLITVISFSTVTVSSFSINNNQEIKVNTLNTQFSKNFGFLNLYGINLQDIITEKNLEKLNSGKDLIPSKEALLMRIKETNWRTRLLTTKDFNIVKQDASNVRIIGQGDYIGEVSLHYTITNFISKKITNEKIYSLATDYKNNIFRTQEDKVYKLTPTGIENLMIGIERGKTIRSIVVDNEDNVYVGNDSGAIYKSDGVHKFTKISLPDSKNWIWDLKVNKNGIVYACNDDGVYKIDKQGNVIHMFGTKDYINSLAIDPDGAVYAGADNRGKIYKSDGNNDFELIENQDDAGSIKSLVVDNSGTIFAGSDNGNVYKIKKEQIYSKILETHHEIKRLVIDKKENLFVGIDSNKVYKKSRHTDLFNELIGIKNYGEHILALALGPDDDLYAAGTEGLLYTAEDFNY